MPGREEAPRRAALAIRRDKNCTAAPFRKPGTSLQQTHKSRAQNGALTPACESCVRQLQCLQAVRQAMENVLANARRVFLDDTLHHQMDDERWIRVLQAIGECKETYYARLPSGELGALDLQSKTT
ncbi:hypothetical protein ERJ75_000460100 [Trypanosoma vivax]|uniref:Uncharacterized protein n=1 Tax=Trypanosoma vivax (strain Y486) TaxID=1055687 RepID=G0U538_TRYVY|nr:hypothetical protein TRVL_02465 [Trypanosoma vivax]KAH8616617.1 hypothetical protein ERJ75_000460100 [Trypanosoma vivax]CCC50986.1 conserved hypothetical protein [Trypanosoma vivax Y486]